MDTENQEWCVEIAAGAQRSLEGLPHRIAIAVVEFISAGLAANPDQRSKPLRGELSELRSARRGDYRVLFEVHEADHVLVIARIDHRARVYRPR